MPSLPPWVVMCPEASGLQMGSPHQSGARHRLQGMGDTAPPPPLGLMKTGALCGKCQKGGPSVSPCPYTTESRWRPSIAGPPRTQPRACSPLSAEQAGAGLSCEPGGGGSSPLGEFRTQNTALPACGSSLALTQPSGSSELLSQGMSSGGSARSALARRGVTPP